MKKYILIIAFAFPVVLYAQEYAQGSNSNFWLPDSCGDCDEVKTAIKASSSKNSSHKIHAGKPLRSGQLFRLRSTQVLKKAFLRKKMRIKIAFSRHKKVRTDYEACFYWFAKKD